MKKRYADKLSMCIEMMSSYSTNDKLKFGLLNADFNIYRCFDEQA